MQYNFDEIIERRNTQSSKWDNVGARVGNPDALPMWVADTDFRVPYPVLDAVKARAEHPIFGYPFVTQDFKDATVNWVKKRHGYEMKPEWVVFACSASLSSPRSSSLPAISLHLNFMMSFIGPCSLFMSNPPCR